MIRLVGLFLGLPSATVGLLLARDAWNLGFIETFAAVVLIIGFAVVATGWTIRHDV